MRPSSGSKSLTALPVLHTSVIPEALSVTVSEAHDLHSIRFAAVGLLSMPAASPSRMVLAVQGSCVQGLQLADRPHQSNLVGRRRWLSNNR